MTTKKRPLTTRERVLVRIGIGFALFISLGGGLSLAAEGYEGRTTLRDGPVGTLAPADRVCNKEQCGWIGTFTSADGTVTERDVKLEDAVRVRSSDAVPSAIGGVRLAENGRTAYTSDYNWHGPVVKGAVLGAVGLAIATGLFLMLRRNRTTKSA
ncbi:hypothetical protein [Streptomyces sp. NPDC058665]|uniref:hypothetical protein n=1 Tax=Streptomyces sp. NPDC058665 TaxID=3346586 RepID=UPI00364D2B77